MRQDDETAEPSPASELKQLREETRRLKRLAIWGLAIGLLAVVVAGVVVLVPNIRDRLTSLSFGSIKNTKLTAENKDKLFDKIKDSKDLTVEEVQLLQAYVMREGVKTALSGGTPSLPIGKTIGELIAEQKKWSEDEKARAEEERQRREAAQAAAEEKRKVLREALSVTLYDKGFEKHAYREYITIKVAYENHTGKDIRGFKGVTVFKDLFGDVILKVSLKEDAPLKAGAKRNVSRMIDFNQFTDGDTKLRSTEMDNLRMDWEPSVILFTDGTSLEAGD